MYPSLFSPIAVGRLQVPNRIALAPVTTRYADSRGHVTDQMIQYYADRARGGCGLTIVEGASISPEGRGWVPHLSAEDDSALPGLRRLAQAITAAGSIPVLQLMHCGRQTRAHITGQQPIAPSAIPCPRFREMPREMTIEDIQRVIQAFIDGARRAQEAGFAAVEIHAAHGYLITQFLSPVSNQRHDWYGGSPERRFRFLREIVAGIQVSCGQNYPLLVRLTAEEYVPDGLTTADAVRHATWLEEMGVAAIHVTATSYGSYPQWVGSMPAGTGYEHFVPHARTVRKAVRIPVIAVGRILYPEQAEAIIARGDADMVALGRALIADPEWAAKARTGQRDRIIPCTGCQACNARTRRPQVVCVANARTGHEPEVEIRHSGRPRTVVILGASLPGMTAAYWLARRGHRPVVFVEGRIGGLYGLRAAVPGLAEYRQLPAFYATELQRLGVPLIEEPFRSDHAVMADAPPVLVATAGEPVALAIPGLNSRQVVEATEVLAGTNLPVGRVVVLGGSLLGIETAYLLGERGIAVTLLEESPTLGFNAHPATRYWRTRGLEETGVVTLTGARVLEAANGVLQVQVGEQIRRLPVDHVVSALGHSAIPERVIQSLASRSASVTVIGDCYEDSEMADLVYQAARAAMSIE